ncbi:MAG: hypothetical protein DRG59_10565 [Deltaproteobacteria bacterium]|nr:MAG: hypothetical protein DRG83_18685 [Deltaproteobacteria bacterium]RLB04241.1 MAG: hypothetical protein DRG59_10565 [Deltaproteobacteria bacterium]
MDARKLESRRGWKRGSFFGLLGPWVEGLLDRGKISEFLFVAFTRSQSILKTELRRTVKDNLFPRIRRFAVFSNALPLEINVPQEFLLHWVQTNKILTVPALAPHARSADKKGTIPPAELSVSVCG